MQIGGMGDQPAWVVIVVAVLLVGGMVTGAWLTSKAKHGPSHKTRGNDSDTVTSDDGTIAIASKAMEHLAEVAKRESDRGSQAKREAEKLRAKLEQCCRDLRDAKGRLAECQEQVEALTIQAWSERDE